MKHTLKYLTLLFGLLSATLVHGQSTDLASEIRIKESELAALKQQNAALNAPAMYGAMTDMVKASSQCVADGIANKGRFTRTASVSKACRAQAQLGAFAICAATIAQTGDTRDINQCVAMMQNQGQWEQVAMRALGVAGMISGTRELGDIVVPLATAAINKVPAAPEVVRPEIVTTPSPLIVRPEIVTPEIIETSNGPL